MRKKIFSNKKGVFFSMSVILLIIFLTVYFSNKAQIAKDEEETHIERAKMLVVDHFTRDFESYYSYTMLATAAKPALVELSRVAYSTRHAATKADMAILMREGAKGAASINPLLTTDENFNQALKTLSFDLDRATYEFLLLGVKQTGSDELELTFKITYRFEAFNSAWSNTRDVAIKTNILGMSHLDYTQDYGTIDDSWVDDNGDDCYIQSIILDAPACSYNVKPAGSD